MRTPLASIRAPSKGAMIQKEFMAHVASRIDPVYLVNEFPKSGGTWLKHMLADSLGVPTWTKGSMSWRSCVLQGHWLKPRGRSRTVALFRDGRDVMVSFYHHAFFLNEFQNGSLVRKMRKQFHFDDYKDIRTNLLPFMRGIHETPISPHFRWIDFVDAWAGRDDVVITRYEDLRADAAAELDRIVFELTGEAPPPGRSAQIVDHYTMEQMRERKADLNPGVAGRQSAEVSFIRKGSVGGWSEAFTDEALEWFDAIHGDALRQLGYETGRPKA
jgi:hypothetical protein